jgi:hypothetical protein
MMGIELGRHQIFGLFETRQLLNHPTQLRNSAKTYNIGGFLKWGIPKSPWVSILKWSNFG